MRHATFTASCADHERFNGRVAIVRKLTRAEADKEVGPMFRCRADNGVEFDAFVDELAE